MHKNRRSLVSLLVYYVVILLLVAIISPSFFAGANFTSILRSTSTTLLGAMGMMFVLLVGEIDVSVGSVLALCCVIAGNLALAGVPLLAIILIVILSGGLMGLINGCVVTFLHLDSIVATLGLLSIYKGIRIIWTGGAWVTGFSDEFLSLGQGTFMGIHYTIFIAIAVMLVVWLVTTKTTFGRNCYAVGSNQEAAHLCSINVRLVKILAFVICGCLVGLTAVMYTSRFGSVQSNTGNGWEMTVISAAVVGGVSTRGGEGSAIPVALGALLISALTTLLVFLGIDSLWEEAVQGIIILLSVCTYSIKLPQWRRKRLGGAKE